MASSPKMVLNQARPGDAGVGGVGKQKKVGGAVEGRSKRGPLNEIGNVVAVREPKAKLRLPQISRPITRSFGAQLQANGAQYKKGDAVPNLHHLNEVNMAKRAPAQKKVLVKPKSVEVIEISPDTAAGIKKDAAANEKAMCHSRSSRNKVATMSSILVARSKAFSGVTKTKTKEQIIDIDAGDVDNELAVVEYVEDIYKFYKIMEKEIQIKDYMVSQPDINEKMRAILVDWLVEVHNKFELMPESLYLTVNLVDRFLAATVVPRRELQLAGISAMLIACKYEEIWAPEVNDLVCISDRVYTNEQILRMEKTILGYLEWELTVPTCYVFLVRYIKASIPDYEMENLVYYLAELALMKYSTLVYSPSMIAASAVLVARHALSRSPAWTETLKVHTGYSESQLMECATMLATVHTTVADSKLQAVYKKYSKSERAAVAQISPAKSLLALSNGAVARAASP
ncbi:G2/mitotic-specific cyclin-1-like protein [Drosera capensis]